MDIALHIVQIAIEASILVAIMHIRHEAIRTRRILSIDSSNAAHPPKQELHE